MEDVTDSVFRQMLARYGRPDIFFTEFTNVDGIFSAGKERVIHRLAFDPEIERPIVAQIWGHKPKNYFEGAKYVKSLGFDGIDINMGCPQRDIVKKGLCGALIGNPDHAAKVIQATIDGSGGLPVSVKTRIGVKEIVTQEWMSFLLGFNLAAITVHGRTVDEKSKVPCHWDEIEKAVRVRNTRGSKTLIIGNGDVINRAQALEKVKKYGVDGVMIARGLLEDIQALSADPKPLSRVDRIQALQTHLDLYTREKRNARKPHGVKKYISTYICGFDGAKALRTQLVESETLEDILMHLNV